MHVVSTKAKLNTNECCDFSYRVVQFEGMSHNPVFTYQVTIGDMSTMGSGNSKKQAKHAAARKSKATKK